MPDYVRAAIAAQGLVDPDEVEATAALIGVDDLPVGERHEPPPVDKTQEAFALEGREEHWWQR
jgi:hypothetical protein